MILLVLLALILFAVAVRLWSAEAEGTVGPQPKRVPQPCGTLDDFSKSRLR
jgi:hypothetical protein